MRRLHHYIHEHKDWPEFTHSLEQLIAAVGEVRLLQGKLIGKMEALGFALREEATLETLTQDILKSSEIEGEILDMKQVRSSIARHLGMDISGLVRSDRNIDGIVQMMLDATRQSKKPLSAQRLYSWHAALFPAGRSGMYKIITGKWRNDKTGPMQVVSGPMGKEKVHFQAPDAKRVNREMSEFIKWFNQKDNLDPVIKAGIAHLWFITIHPFDDGNGRIARAIADMQLTKSDGSLQRFYSMSAQIKIERKRYYEILEQTQKGKLDITDWLAWFLNCLTSALKATDKTLAKVLFKVQFWERHGRTHLSPRQRNIINKLLDGFDGKLTSSKWAKITKCSADTALRDIQDLISKEILRKEQSGGRSTSYMLND